MLTHLGGVVGELLQRVTVHRTQLGRILDAVQVPDRRPGPAQAFVEPLQRRDEGIEIARRRIGHQGLDRGAILGQNGVDRGRNVLGRDGGEVGQLGGRQQGIGGRDHPPKVTSRRREIKPVPESMPGVRAAGA
jgi:hypothetical protein